MKLHKYINIYIYIYEYLNKYKYIYIYIWIYKFRQSWALSGGFEKWVYGMGSSEWWVWGMSSSEWVWVMGFRKAQKMGVVGCNQIELSLNKKKWKGRRSWRGLPTRLKPVWALLDKDWGDFRQGWVWTDGFEQANKGRKRNRALTVAWRGRGRLSDRRGCASGGVCLSSVSVSLFRCGVRKMVEGKMSA